MFRLRPRLFRSKRACDLRYGSTPSTNVSPIIFDLRIPQRRSVHYPALSARWCDYGQSAFMQWVTANQGFSRSAPPLIARLPTSRHQKRVLNTATSCITRCTYPYIEARNPTTMSAEPGIQIIVVGGGLAGLSAANTALECGGNVLMLDKNTAFGGNSVKAASGINGAPTQTQIDKGVQDSYRTFYDDSIKSARSRAHPELLHTLVSKSSSAIDWLDERFGLKMNEVSLLAGHSKPRTHRGTHPDYPYKPLAFVLLDQTEKYSVAHPDRLVIKKNARVSKLLLNEDHSAVTGVEYEFDGATHKAYGPVILATGGYAADYSEDSLLRLYHPEALSLATTNGPYCTGDGHKMVMSIGGNTVDLDLVQIHPTGWVDPKNRDAKTKFLAAEALRGSGGILVNAKGERFVDELAYRDELTAEMRKTESPVFLVLNSAAAKEVANFVKFYSFKGLMSTVPGNKLAEALHCSEEKLNATFAAYNKALAGEEPDPFGRKLFGKQPLLFEDEFTFGEVQPVLHYTMGGVQVNNKSQVLSTSGNPIGGLYAAGEIVGGLHGENRLGGSSLLACVVFGRLAGEGASADVLHTLMPSAPATVFSEGAATEKSS
ncbi:fumerate reductase [Schizosaccharomyces japonicus yFS275]|uniref:fumarate reductase (NADH) n=1 Tax=Schizosaccharomyces japonicus (strain yFS275 / FY16936) TaxID=402676 RepID=B6JXR0_SCHJY|nr:fumerate reductase [Schizosaccharomyces japonicus yFS275]EEB05204.1 fumerate reductase [Schizosaccharomyces japonicus yFS275]